MVAKAVDLVSYGAGEGIYYCLNAMAALFHGGKHSFVGSIMLIVSMVSVVIAAYRMVIEQNLRIPANWLLANSLLLISLTVPTVNVMVIDRVTGFRAPVANVPWLFGVPAGTISQIGDAVAVQIDKNFSLPGNVNTPTTLRQILTAERKSIAMNAKIVANASHFDFISHDMANNVREFVKECVYYDIALQKYSVDDLKNSDNLWKLVSEKASPLGGVIYKDSKKAPVEFLTCKQAAIKIEKAWPEERNKAYKFYGKKLFPFGGKIANVDPGALLRENLVDAYTYLTGVSKSADEIMQQNIMRNAIQDGFLTRAQEDGATASIQSFAATRAEAYQQSVYDTQGGIATKAISYMKIVIEIIFYAMFPFVSMLVVLPAGQTMLKTYFTGLIWLQTWAPLYSIINMIIAVYCTEHTFSASATLNDPALTYDTIPALGEAAQAVSSYANYAMMSVPFLSWGLLKYGGGAMAQLSTSLSQPTQSASGMAAQEATSGNFSMGVRNFDSTSKHNINSFKQDENANIASGSTSFQANDGSILKVTSGGNNVIDKISGMSKLGVALNDKNELSENMNQMSAKSLAKAQASLDSYSNSMSAGYDLMRDFRKSRGESSSKDTSIGMDESSSMSEAIYRADNIVKSFSEVTGSDERKSRERLVSLSAGLSGSLGVGKGGLFGFPISGNAAVNAGLGYKNQWSNSNVSNVNTTSQDQLQMAQDYKQAMDEITRIAKSKSFRDSSTESANLSDGLSSKFSEAETHRRDMQKSLNESESWQQSANLVTSSGSSVTDDLSQDFVNYGIYQLDSNGNEYRMNGLNEALNDPAQRAKLIEGFMEARKEKIFETYVENKLKGSRIEGVHDDKHLGYGDGLQQKYNKTNEFISNAASTHGLDNLVNMQERKDFEKQLESNSKSFSEHQQTIMVKKQELGQKKDAFDENHPLKKD